jgi:hypothetical protein
MAASHRGSVRGSVIASRIAFVRANGGESGLAKVLARMTEVERRTLANPIVAMNWYPFEMNAHLDRAIADELGNGDRIFRELGAASARDNLTRPEQQTFVKNKDPHGLLQQASAIYGVYYDTGHRWYERVNDKKAVLRTMVSLSYSLEDCLTVVGWHETAISMCGGGNVQVSEPLCRAKGHPVCEYVCEWT